MTAPEDGSERLQVSAGWKRRLQELERRATSVLRSPTARWFGFVVGLAAFGLFIATFVRSGARATDLIAGRSLASFLPALIGVLVFQSAAIATLGRVGANENARVWAASQLAKYLPVPASAAVGMLGSSVRAGHSPRRALRILVVHSILLVGGGTVVGSVAAGTLVDGADVWPPSWLSIVVLAAGFAVTALALRSSEERSRITTACIAVAGWAAVGVGMGMTFTTRGDWQTAVVLGSAYSAGWVAGQIVVPVPAGLGVREGALVALLAPNIGSAAALAFAILSRAIHMLADGMIAFAVLVIRPIVQNGSDR